MLTRLSGVGRVPGWLGFSEDMIVGFSARITSALAVYELFRNWYIRDENHLRGFLLKKTTSHNLSQATVIAKML
jgi:hypothetical protein